MAEPARAPASDPLLAVRGLNAWYGESHILHGVDFDVREGEVVTACQSACPTKAIDFGAMSDPGSRVSHLRADPRAYSLLGELGTRPRTTYLARLQNPNPDYGKARS